MIGLPPNSYVGKRILNATWEEHWRMFKLGGPHPRGVIKRHDGGALPFTSSGGILYIGTKKSSSLDYTASKSHLESGDQFSPDTKLIALISISSASTIVRQEFQSILDEGV